MYLKANIEVDSIALIKIVGTEKANMAGDTTHEDKDAKKD